MYDNLVKRLRSQCRGYGKECEDCNADGNCRSQMENEGADAIEELQAQLMYSNDAAKEIAEKVPKWIPVTEKLPEEEEPVFVVRKFLGVKGQVPPSTYTEIAYRCGDRWIADSDEYKIARHRHTDPLYWMPLPSLPKEGT